MVLPRPGEPPLPEMVEQPPDTSTPTPSPAPEGTRPPSGEWVEVPPPEKEPPGYGEWLGKAGSKAAEGTKWFVKKSLKGAAQHLLIPAVGLGAGALWWSGKKSAMISTEAALFAINASAAAAVGLGWAIGKKVRPSGPKQRPADPSWGSSIDPSAIEEGRTNLTPRQRQHIPREGQTFRPPMAPHPPPQPNPEPTAWQKWRLEQFKRQWGIS